MSEKSIPDGMTGWQSWVYAWPVSNCARCDKIISDDVADERGYYNRYGWINPEDPEEILCYDCKKAELEQSSEDASEEEG